MIYAHSNKPTYLTSAWHNRVGLRPRIQRDSSNPWPHIQYSSFFGTKNIRIFFQLPNVFGSGSRQTSCPIPRGFLRRRILAAVEELRSRLFAAVFWRQFEKGTGHLERAHHVPDHGNERRLLFGDVSTPQLSANSAEHQRWPLLASGGDLAVLQRWAANPSMSWIRRHLKNSKRNFPAVPKNRKNDTSTFRAPNPFN